MIKLVLGTLMALGACTPEAALPPVRLVESSNTGRRTLAVLPSPGVRINARLPPAVELPGGSVIRLSRGRVSGDSGYFAEPPWEVHPGLPIVGAALRVSYCRNDEQLCRSVVLPVVLR